VAVFPSIRAGIKAFTGERRERGARRHASRMFAVKAMTVPNLGHVTGRYLVSSDEGVFAIADGRLLQLFAGDTFGIARRGEELFIATSTNRTSRVIRARLPEPIAPGRLVRCEEVYEVATPKHGRIHQLALFRDRVAVCQTSANAIVLLDPETGRVERAIHPMADAAGTPIAVDHNHLNSASACGDVLLFCLYRAGAGSLLGVLGADRVRGYAVRNVGAHDVHVSGTDIYYSDTFGETYTTGRSGHGYLMVNGKRFDEPFFARSGGYAVRGFSQAGGELLIGHSHKGSRRTRFAGRGALVRCVAGKAVEEIAMPFSQVYDVLTLAGPHFDTEPAVGTWDDVNALFASVFGPPVYEHAV
jgi:hypothetical protein